MSLNNRNYEEKRDFIRMTLNASANISLANGDSLPVTCIDLSAGGMSIRSEHPVSVGDVIHVLIGSPNEQFNSMDADGEILRCQDLGNGEFELGVEIKKID